MTNIIDKNLISAELDIAQVLLKDKNIAYTNDDISVLEKSVHSKFIERKSIKLITNIFNLLHMPFAIQKIQRVEQAQPLRLFYIYKLIFLLLFSSSLFAQNSWTSRTNFGGGIRQGAVGFTIGTKGYFGTGQNLAAQKDLWEYDPSGNTWSQKADFGGVARTGATGVATSTKGYIGLGTDFAGLSVYQDFWEYDPTGNSWTQKANFGGSARKLASGFSLNEKVYIGIGATLLASLDDFYEYDPSGNSWTQKANYGGGIRSNASSFAIANLGYIGCGTTGLAKQNDFWQYNPNTNTWTQKTNFGGTARIATVGFNIYNKGYIAAGTTTLNVSDMYEYDASLDTWLSRANFGGGSRASGAGFGIAGFGYMGTGNNITNQQDLYRYTPGTTASVNTTIISSISTTTASSGGNVVFDGTYSVTARGVVWSTFANPTVALGTKTTDGTGTGTFTSSITGLTAGTQYYYRAYATNSQGTSYGTEYTFTTVNNVPNSWARHTDFFEARSNAISFSIGTKGYVGTGTNSSANYYKDFWEYDPSTCQWTQKADLGATGRNSGIGFSVGSYGYAGLGTNGGLANDWWKYDPTGNTWTQMSNYGGSGRYSPAGFFIGTDIFVGTGFDGVNKNDFYKYNTLTDTWTQVANFTGSARRYASGAQVLSKGYVGLGYDGANKNDWYEYDPIGNTWTVKTNYPSTARQLASAFSITNKVYITCGTTGTSQNDLYEYDPTLNTWTAKTAFTGSIRYSAFSFTIDDVAYVGGGETAGPSYFSNMFEYTPGTSPSVNTTTASSIALTSASSGGEVTFNGNYTLTNRGVVWSTSSNPTIISQPGGGISNNGAIVGSYTSALTGLTAGTQYYYRAYATNSQGTSYGTEYTFTTLTAAPTVTTTSITSISTTSASSGGNVTNDNGASVTSRGLVWSSSTNTPTIASYDGITSNSTGTGSFTQTLNALCPGTTYYVRAYATNSVGTSYGTAETFTSTASAGDIWVQKANFGGTARYGAAHFSIGVKGYITCGQDVGSTKNDLWEFDPFSNVWTQKANFAGATRERPAFFVIGTKAYVGLGFNGGYLSDFYEYNPTTNTWTAIASFGGSARYSTFHFSIGSKGYVGGGENGSYLQDFWEYDQTGNTWTTKANFGGGNRGFATAIAIGTKGYAGLGYDGVVNKNDFWEYDPIGNTWTSKTSFGGAIRSLASGFTIGNKGYIGLGAGASNFNDLFEYDPTQNIWTQKTNFTGVARQMASAFAIGTKGYFGVGYNGSYQQDFYEYTPNTIPQFISGSAASITQTAATISATYDANYNGCSSEAITDKGFVWHTSTAPTTTTNTGSYSAGTGIGAISHTITGLSAITTYYVRSYSTSAQGIRYGNEVSFTTLANAPTVTTTAVSSIGITTASSGGNVTADGGDAVTVRGLVWSSSTNTPTIATYDGITTNGTGTGSFTQTLNALCPSTTYYVRAYATNNIGTSYGTAETFTTTASAGDIWVQKANFGGVARRNASSFAIANYIYYGLGTNGTNQQDFWEFDANANVWTQKANFGGAARFDGKGFTINNKGYISSGGDGTLNYNDLWEYNKSTNVWTQKSSYGAVGRWGGVAFAIGTKGYFGTGAVLMQDFWEWDSGSDTWVQKANYPLATRNAVGFSVGSYGYIGTGVISGSTENHFFQYNPSNNTWTQKEDYEGGIRENSVGFSIGTKGYIATGDDAVLKNDMWEYNPDYDVWTRRGDFGGSARRQATASSSSHKGYLGLGLDGSNKNDIYEYTPSTFPTYYLTDTSYTYATSIRFTAAKDLNFSGCQNLSLTAQGMVWHTAANPTTTTNTGSYAAGSGNSFNYTITGLTPATTYYARAYTSTAQGTLYGNEFTFSTSDTTATLITTSVTSISTTAASSGANITSDGGDAVTVRGLVWSSSTNTPTIVTYDGITTNGTGTGSFTQTLNALCPGTTYYVRAYATNGIGTSYGTAETFTTTASAGDIWVQKANFGGLTRYGSSSFVIDDLAYVGLGYDISTPLFVDFWVYNPSSDTWTQVADYIGSARAMAQSFTANSKGYIVGGWDGGFYDDVYEYNPSTNSWIQKSDFPGWNRAYGNGFTINNKGYVSSGWSCCTNFNDLWEYNALTDSWTQKASYGGAVRDEAMAFVIGDKAYLGGGNVGTNDYWSYDVNTDEWVQIATYPGNGTHGGVGFSVGNKGYIHLTNTIWEYDISENIWIKKADYPGGAAERPVAFNIGSKAYLGVGYQSGQSFYEYTPSNIAMFFIDNASDISYHTATLDAEYDNNFNGCNDLSITDKGFVWHTSTNPSLSTNSGSYSAGSGISDYTATISLLTHSTTYYVRVYTSSSYGTIYGNERTFSTLIPIIPTIYTDTATNVSQFSAKSGGYDIVENGEAVISKGVVWSTNPNPTLSDFNINEGSDTTSFSSDLTNLEAGTKYYYRAYATNNVGIAYGQELSFTTISDNDSDNDGVADDIENLGPNGGDGNGDGILDSEQEFVTTIAVNLDDEFESGSTSGNSEFEYLTIEVSSCTKIFSVQTFRKIESDNFTFPAGIVEFELPCKSASVKLIYHNISDWTGYVYRKLSAENRWINYNNAQFSTEKIGGRIVGTIILGLEDGGLGDYDGKVNGTIVDPGGPAFISNASINVPFWDDFWRIFAIAGLIIIPIWWLKRK